VGEEFLKLSFVERAAQNLNIGLKTAEAVGTQQRLACANVFRFTARRLFDGITAMAKTALESGRKPDDSDGRLPKMIS
jgi:hypothetical protein